jgi:flagellar operon protein
MSAPIQNNKIADLMTQRVGLDRPGTPVAPNPTDVKGPNFDSVLQDRLKLSGHAQTRLQSRNIDLGQPEWDRVMKGVERAAQKGAKESLVMVDDVALVVSIKNRTVITAVDKDNLKENVFTNIDSAVIV